MSNIVMKINGELFTTSEQIAEGAGVQHKNVLETITKYMTDFERFGRVAFETRTLETAGGKQSRRVAILNEHQATLLLTYARNTDQVRRFKSDLVAAFYDMAQALNKPKSTAQRALEVMHELEQIVE